MPNELVRHQEPEGVRALLLKILNLPVPPESLKQYGLLLQKTPESMTKAELIMYQLVERACSGDLVAINQLFDRLIGKPLQVTENTTRVLTYRDFLSDVAHKEQMAKHKIVDVEAIPLPPESNIEQDLLG